MSLNFITKRWIIVPTLIDRMKIKQDNAYKALSTMFDFW